MHTAMFTNRSRTFLVSGEKLAFKNASRFANMIGLALFLAGMPVPNPLTAV